MKATAQLTVPDEALLTITLQLTVRDAKRLREQVTGPQQAPYWVPPLENLVEVLRAAIATAETAHAAEIDTKP